MASFNKIILMGNLTRDPELRYTQNGKAVCNFDIAVNETTGTGEERKEEVLFIKISAWNRQAETCGQYLKKGAPVLVDGRLKISTWESEGGEKKSRPEVVANLVQFLPKGDSQKSGNPESVGGVSVDAALADDSIPF